MRSSNFEEVVHSVSRWLKWLAVGALLAMMLVVGAHVLLRFFDLPIEGSYEIIQYLMVIVIASGLAYTAAVRGNIAVSILVRRFPQRIQAVVDGITCFISMVMFAMLAWRIVLYGMDLWRTGTLSSVLRVPYFHYIFLAAFGFAMLCLVLLTDLCKSFLRVVRK